MAVLLGVVVAGVEQALARGAETDDRSCTNMSNLPVMCWILEDAVIESALPGAAIGPVVQGMQVTVSVAKGQLDADGQPVGRHREASLLKGGDRRLDCLGADRKVDISVLSCLCPDKGVDPPASGQTRISADRLECVQDS